MVTGFFAEISKGAAGHTVWFAMFGSLWAALNGTWAVMSGLNAAYEVEERRSWWQVTLTGAGLTIALAVLGFTSLVLLFYSRKIEAAITTIASVTDGTGSIARAAASSSLARRSNCAARSLSLAIRPPAACRRPAPRERGCRARPAIRRRGAR